MAEKLW